MKKSFLAIGLLSMVMVLTSFTTTNKVKSTLGADLKSNVTVAYGGGSGSQGAGQVIKKD
ncbi:MAG: hypothetical protein V4572_00875 [Bacteroidota bacterium]